MICIAKPNLGKEEACAAYDAVLSGWVTQGPRVKEFEDKFAAYVGAKHACAVSSCTTALHLALLAVGVQPGDVVVTVSHSFIATANSVRYCGAEPVFVDIDPTTFNMSPARLEEFLEEKCARRNGGLYLKELTLLLRRESPFLFYAKNFKRTSLGKLGRIAAIMPVHQMGMPCDMKVILSIARKYQLPVIEDAACAIGSEISFDEGKKWERIGRPHGDIACFSFHPRKIITTGDGGMLTTNNPAYDRKFRLLRQHGMTVSDAKRHGSQKVIFENYSTTGFNYRMTDIQAAVGNTQLDRLKEIVGKRRFLAGRYKRLLSEITGLGIPAEPSWARSNWQSYCVRLPKGSNQRQVMQAMLDKGIATRRGIMCSHSEEAYSRSGYSTHLKESELAQKNSIILPLYSQMSELNQGLVCEALSGACFAR